jgi:hypothetical protein
VVSRILEKIWERDMAVKRFKLRIGDTEKTELML